MKVKKISVFISLALFGFVVNGQVRQPHSLYFMETIPQISQMNPAFQPRANGYVILPANYNLDVRSGFAVKDIFQQQGNKWYTPLEKQYNYDKFYKSIGKKAATFNSEGDWDIIGFGFRTSDNGYFSFGISEHQFGNLALPRDLFKITENGFPSGTVLDFSPLHTRSMSYLQFNIGYSSKINDRLTIGVKVKPLFGQLVVTSKIDKFKLHTGEQLWDIDAKGSIYSSLPIEEVITDAEGKIKEINFRDLDDYKVKDLIREYGTAFNNPGIALDLGAAYQINERLIVSASLNNLGFISWTKDLNGIDFNGKYAFNGVYYDASTDNDDLFKNLGDSIADAMNYVVQHDKFKTMLSPIFYAGASYDLSKSMSIGLLSRSVFWQNGVSQSFNASFNLQPYSFIALNAGATWQIKGNVYLGGGMMFHLRPLPLQVYILSDFIPLNYSTVKIDNEKEFSVFERQKSATIRVGINLIFGRHGYTNKPMLDRGKSSWN